MPLTPFHWSAVILGLLFFSTLYIPALAISSVLIDLEPFYYIFISPHTSEVHGFFHTYLGATLIAIVVALILIKARKTVDKIMSFFRLEQGNASNSWVYCSSLIAAYSHILLDSFLYSDIEPFWPLTKENAFLGLVQSSDVYLFTIILIIASILIYFFRVLKITFFAKKG